jgi:8-oxo-dGTP pyrophosphatase MutT (NUDIX family)
MPEKIAIPTAAAVIEYNREVFLQERDDIPGIVYPGMLQLFGGRLKANELPKVGVARELREETSLDFSDDDLTFLWDQDFEGIAADGKPTLKHPYVYHLPVNQEHFEVYEGIGYVRVNEGNYTQHKPNIPLFTAKILENFWKGEMKNVRSN